MKRLHEKIAIIHLLLMQSTGLHGLKFVAIKPLSRSNLMQSTGLHGLKFIVCVHFLTFIWMQSTGLYGLE